MRFPCDDFFEYPAEGVQFIHHPFSVLSASLRRNIEAILTSTYRWQILLEMMTETNQRSIQLEGKTGGEYLMEKLSNQDGTTITDLVIHLDKVKCRRAMLLLREYVDEKYQVLMDDTEHDIRVFLKRVSLHLEYEYRKKFLPQFGGVHQRARIQPLDICDYMYSIEMYNYKPYFEIERMTYRFRRSRILYRGTFSTYYSAEVDDGGVRKDVCVRCFRFCQQGDFEFNTFELQMALNEIKYLQLFQHENILEMWGFTFWAPDLFLAYVCPDFFSLHLYISLSDPIDTPLPYFQRFRICRGIASGITYLHTYRDLPLIHTLIRPENIFLNGALTPKICNFAYATDGPLATEPPKPREEMYEFSGYFPYEYNTSPHYLSTKVDVYSFGVTLMQLIIRQSFCRNHDEYEIRNRVHNSVNRNGSLVYLLDAQNPPSRSELSVCIRLLYIAYMCTKLNYTVRPEMKNVLTRLRELF